MNESPAPSTNVAGKTHPVLRHFLYGQYGNLFKLSLWWVALAPLTFALLKRDEAIGVGRIVYNSALCLLSPIGGILIEHVAPRTVLLHTTWIRFVIWCICLPLVWLMMDRQWVSDVETVAYVCLNIMLFFDGVSVGLGNILDIDGCGVDMLGGFHGIDIDDDVRNFFNTRHEIFFAICFVVLSPVLAVLGYVLRDSLSDSSSMNHDQATSLIMVGIFVVGFFLASVLSIYHYGMIPSKHISKEEMSEPLVDAATSELPASSSTWSQIMVTFAGLGETVGVIWRHGCIKWRLLFLALEIALEDAVIIVVAADVALHASYFGNEDAVVANCWSAGLIAVGKVGGVVASYVMMHKFSPPEDIQGYRKLFIFIFIGAICTVGFPLGHMLAHENKDNKLLRDLGIAVTFVAYFTFFFFSTLPKLGFMCLLQSLASQIESGGRIFGFIAIIVTSVDALVVMGLSLAFRHFALQEALWVTFGVFLVHGVLELIVGPILILQPLEPEPGSIAAEVEPGAPSTLEHGPQHPEDESTGTYSTNIATTEDPRHDRVHSISIGTGPTPKAGSYARSPISRGPISSGLDGGRQRGFSQLGSARRVSQLTPSARTRGISGITPGPVAHSVSHSLSMPPT
eukprot:PhM_4_TR14268/c0_g1_i1/m.59724